MPTRSAWVSDETDQRIERFKSDEQTDSQAVSELIRAGLDRQDRLENGPNASEWQEEGSSRWFLVLAVGFAFLFLTAAAYGLLWIAQNLSVSVS